jgi:hypothetical protein
LLQELRVAQTGVQVLVAFLLTIPFTPGFRELIQTQRNLYAVDLTCAVAATALLVSPVAIHRAIFGQRLLDDLDFAADRGARARHQAQLRFSLDRFLADWDDVLHEVAGEAVAQAK